jgi:hypothetical protein
MKALLFAAIVSLVGVSQAQANCAVEFTHDGQTEAFTPKMEPVVKPGTDLASYVYENYINDFYIRLMEVDGNYFATIKSPAQSVHAGPEEAIELELSHAGQTLKAICQ